MIKKWFRGFGYIFLVVPSLDFMLTVKSSQKLSVPSVPNFKNVDFYSEKEGFSAIFDNYTSYECLHTTYLRPKSNSALNFELDDV